MEKNEAGMLTISRKSDGQVLLTEMRRILNTTEGSYVTFDFSQSASTLYGLGQNRVPATGQNGLPLNVSNQTYSVQSSIWEQGGASTSLPWVVGGHPNTGWQFGLLFNSPTLGGVVFNLTNMTRRSASAV
eukprot:SAG31_NODE_20598_length_570_cov_0.560510_1_plen_130_part_00